MLATRADEAVQTVRDAFIAAHASMGAVKNTDAMASIDKELAADPGSDQKAQEEASTDFGEIGWLFTQPR